MRAVFDTCILIDYLNGNETAREVLDRADEAWISIVTWMEVMNAAEDDDERKSLERFLSSFHVHPLTQRIAREAVRIVSTMDMGMAQATILSTSRHLRCELVTWYPTPVGEKSRSTLSDEMIRELQTGRRSSKPPLPSSEA